MADPEPQAAGGIDLRAEQGVPAGGGGAPPASGLNWPLLGGLLVILVLVVASNVWLRRRATRDRDREE
jgi:hypothetical protein